MKWIVLFCFCEEDETWGMVRDEVLEILQCRGEPQPLQFQLSIIIGSGGAVWGPPSHP